MANEEAREAAFETWAAGVIYNNLPLTERKGIPYFLASKAYAAGVAEGIRRAREAVAGEALEDNTDDREDEVYMDAIHDALAAIDALLTDE